MYKTNNHVHTGRAVVARAAAAAPDALREWSSSLPGDEFCLFLKTGTPFGLLVWALAKKRCWQYHFNDERVLAMSQHGKAEQEGEK